jgi:hypothetical protein
VKQDAAGKMFSSPAPAPVCDTVPFVLAAFTGGLSRLAVVNVLGSAGTELPLLVRISRTLKVSARTSPYDPAAGHRPCRPVATLAYRVKP